MQFYSNTVTAKLEGFARARGLRYGIVISPGNASGRYFVVNRNGKPTTSWSSLGWSVDEAREALERHAADASETEVKS